MINSPCRAIGADLGRKTVEYLPPAGSVETACSGLAKKYPDALLFSAGALTGSLVQASSVLSVSAGGSNCIVRGHCGPGLRRCGADVLAVTGSSDGPCGLVLGEDKGFYFSCGVPADIPSLRLRFERESEACRPLFEPAFLLAGPAAFSQAPMPAVSLNAGIAPRTSRLALEMARRGLAGISFAGSRPVLSPLPPDHPLCRMVKAEPVRKTSLAGILKAACPDAGPGRLPQPGRSIACFGCPSPCGFWISAGSGDPVPCTSPEGLALLSAAGADETRLAALFAFADKWGLDPAGLTSLASGTMPEDLASWDMQGALPAGDAAQLPGEAAASASGVCPFFLARHKRFAGELETLSPLSR